MTFYDLHAMWGLRIEIIKMSKAYHISRRYGLCTRVAAAYKRNLLRVSSDIIQSITISELFICIWYRMLEPFYKEYKWRFQIRWMLYLCFRENHSYGMSYYCKTINICIDVNIFKIPYFIWKIDSWINKCNDGPILMILGIYLLYYYSLFLRISCWCSLNSV